MPRLALALIAVMALALAACGDDDDTATAGDATDGSASGGDDTAGGDGTAGDDTSGDGADGSASDGDDTAGDDGTSGGAPDSDEPRPDEGETTDGRSASGGDDTAGDDTDEGDTDAAAGTRPADGVDAYPIANLSVTVTHPDRATVTYVISCLGDTATVLGSDAVAAPAACGALNDPEVRALLTQGPPTDRMCTQEFGGPDEAVVEGLLDDIAVEVTVARTDGCAIDDWDRVLADVLPPAVGVAD